MKTTVDIPEDVLRDAMRNTHSKTKRAAILAALDEMNRRHAQAEVAHFFGRFKSLMTNEQIEALEREKTAPVGRRP